LAYEIKCDVPRFQYVEPCEGFERGGNQEFVQFLYVAKGSCGEVRSQLYVALDPQYVDKKVADNFLIILKCLSAMI
jgi:four helix bundle protein